MPPYDLWLQGADEIGAWLLRVGRECANSVFVPVAVNGTLGFTQHRRNGPGGAPEPFGVTVIEGTGGLVTAVHAFLDPAAVARFESGGSAA